MKIDEIISGLKRIKKYKNKIIYDIEYLTGIVY